MEEPEEVKKIDWRTQGVTWTTEPFTDPVTKRTFPAGSPVKLLAKVRQGKADFFVAIPNASSLFLNLSRDFHDEAAKCMRACLAEERAMEPLSDAPAFSFFENMMGSVVFACTALEAFVNESVPDDFVYVEKSEKRFTAHYNKDQIERNLSLKVKLSAVLPEALKVPVNTGGKLWFKVTKMIDLRDRIIHLKAKDRRSTVDKPDSLWNDLFTSPLLETHVTAKQFITHFLSLSKEPPRWFQKYPF